MTTPRKSKKRKTPRLTLVPYRRPFYTDKPNGCAVQKVSDCWDWMSPEDVIRHALAAYYMACRRQEVEPLENRNAGYEKYPPSSWCDRSTFMLDLAEIFQLRVFQDAHETFGHPHTGYAKDRLVFLAPENLAKNPPDLTVIRNSEYPVNTHCRTIGNLTESVIPPKPIAPRSRAMRPWPAAVSG